MYDTLANLFSTLAPFDEWREAQSVFQRAAAGSPAHWLLPARACQAVGGSLESAIPASLAVACAHVSILLVDDMLDSDPRGVHQLLGEPSTSNLACAFQAAAISSLAKGIQEPFACLSIQTRFNEMFQFTAFGQSLDVQAIEDEDAYWRVAQTKSAPFFGAALQAGALAGGAASEVSEQLYKLGCIYGEMIQVHDDLHDVMESPANPDWLQGRKPLPILFASRVRHPQQARFLDLAQQITQTGALTEAQEILIQCGAVSYCVDQLLKRHQVAGTILDKLSLQQTAPITSLVESVIAPVHQLLKNCG